MIGERYPGTEKGLRCQAFKNDIVEYLGRREGGWVYAGSGVEEAGNVSRLPPSPPPPT
jgi:hypothetical protein